MITSQNPITVSHPEIPFNRLQIESFIVSSRLNDSNNGFTSNVVMRVRYFRQLPDGTYEFTKEKEYTENISDLENAVLSDSILATTFNTVLTALVTHLNLRGA